MCVRVYVFLHVPSRLFALMVCAQQEKALLLGGRLSLSIASPLVHTLYVGEGARGVGGVKGGEHSCDVAYS